MTVKEQAVEALEALPVGATMEDIFERLYLIHEVQRGIAQADAGEGLTADEAKQRMARWLG